MPEQESLPIEPELDELRQRLFSDYQDYRRQCPQDKVSLDTWLVEAIRTRDSRIQALERERNEAAVLVHTCHFQFIESMEYHDLGAWRDNAERMAPLLDEFIERPWVKQAVVEADAREDSALASLPPEDATP